MHILFILNFFTFESFACMCVYAPSACLVPEEARRRQQVPWEWNRVVVNCRAVLGTGPGSSERTAIALKCWAILLALLLLDFDRRCLQYPFPFWLPEWCCAVFPRWLFLLAQPLLWSLPSLRNGASSSLPLVTGYPEVWALVSVQVLLAGTASVQLRLLLHWMWEVR